MATAMITVTRRLFGPARPKNSLAFVFYATSERYAAAVLVFGHLLGIITRLVAAFSHVPMNHYRMTRSLADAEEIFGLAC